MANKEKKSVKSIDDFENRLKEEKTSGKKIPSDTANLKTGFHPSNAEENYVYNMKESIPSHMEIAYKDKNPKNWKFANLYLVPKKKEDKKKDDK